MINLRGCHTIEVFRATLKDRHGEAVTTRVGTISNVFIQWVTPDSNKGKFQETSTLTAVAFAPRQTEVQLQARDRFKLNGETFQVIGDRLWDENHPVTDYYFGYYMVQIEMVS